MRLLFNVSSQTATRFGERLSKSERHPTPSGNSCSTRMNAELQGINPQATYTKKRPLEDGCWYLGPLGVSEETFSSC